LPDGSTLMAPQRTAAIRLDELSNSRRMARNNGSNFQSWLRAAGSERGMVWQVLDRPVVSSTGNPRHPSNMLKKAYYRRA
jgi:hypothetical protein